MDGAPIEATEAPTVWDALNDAQSMPSNNIYSSVTQKLRKEKGQSLDAFMLTFMHSIEQRWVGGGEHSFLDSIRDCLFWGVLCLT